MKTAPIKHWPAAKVELMPVSRLVPYARNSRTHSDEQVAQIAASINEWGWTIPVLVDEGGQLIAGHGRIMAARKLGLTEVPAMTAMGWTEAQKKAYVIADNKLALNAGWDLDALKVELADLGELGFDVGLTGFGDDELADLLAEQTEGLTDPDDVPEPPADPVSVEGDVWILGNHHIICGSSTDAHTVEKLLAGAMPHLTLTDPPYGLGDTSSKKNDYGTYDDSLDNLKQLIADFLPLAQSVTKTVVLTPGVGNMHYYPKPDWTMAWFTPAGVGSGPWGFCCWQPIMCWGKDPMLASGRGRHPDALTHTEKASSSEHPCAKPIMFWKWLMERVSLERDHIYEPFSGSGTTIIAGEMTGRHIYAIELNPAYVDVAVKRWQEFTGKEATLEATGATFAQVAEDKTNANAAA
jgi:hypothetical protein